MSAQSRYLTSKLGLGRGAGFCLCIGLVPFMLGTAEMFGLLVTGVALLLLGVACAPGLVAVSVQQSDRQGDSRTRAHSVQQYYDLPKIWPDPEQRDPVDPRGSTARRADLCKDRAAVRRQNTNAQGLVMRRSARSPGRCSA